jgi:hypothetical protein
MDYEALYRRDECDEIVGIINCYEKRPPFTFVVAEKENDKKLPHLHTICHMSARSGRFDT